MSELKTSYQICSEKMEKGKYIKDIIPLLLQRREQIFSKKVPTMGCIAGDDGFLQYYYKCLLCGTIVVEDNGEFEDIRNYKCPTCNPNQQNFPFYFIPAEEIDKYIAPGFGWYSPRIGCVVPLRLRLKKGLI